MEDCISPPYIETFNSKLIKRFRTWTRSRYVFSNSEILMFYRYEHYMSISHMTIFVYFLFYMWVKRTEEELNVWSMIVKFLLSLWTTCFGLYFMCEVRQLGLKMMSSDYYPCLPVEDANYLLLNAECYLYTFKRLECSPMARETWVQSQVESYQRLKKMVLDASLLNT